MINLIILLLSISGFVNAFYLFWQHKREVNTGQKMFCLIGGDCAAVVGSKYGKTFGIKNELIGMTFYFLLSFYSLTSLLAPSLRNFLIIPKLITLIAAVFSLYLLFIQTIVLKKLCSWCLIAILVNLLIFYLLFKF